MGVFGILGVLLCIKIYCFIFSIEVQLVYNVVSGVQHSDSVTHISVYIILQILSRKAPPVLNQKVWEHRKKVWGNDSRRIGR